MFQTEQRNLNEKHLNLLFCDPRCLVLQAVQKSNGVCVHTKPTSNPCSSRSVWKPCSNCHDEHLNLLFCDPRCLVLQAVQKSNGVVFTRSRQAIRVHLAPFGNRAQIVMAKVTFSSNFASARHSVNATAYCDVSAPFSNHSSVV